MFRLDIAMGLPPADDYVSVALVLRNVMSIKSDSFSGVVLTKKDAEKFRSQVTYGRPNAAAVESVRRGLKHTDEFQKTGKVVFELKGLNIA